MSKNFKLSEFLASETAYQMGRKVTFEAGHEANAMRLINGILQPLRDHLKRRIDVTSGYRPPWLNKAVGGSEDSDHQEALASDITSPSATPREIAEAIIELGLPFKQLILEHDKWVHVSIPKLGEEPRREILTAIKRGGKTFYERGLV